ncbi:hypothetical protein LGT39_12550 [Demequina sp. TTPB684]|uniref:hypothetical protein n=1 Tax=unclassified Demequina TaxID=2620311 RepID=UPI001CF14401|nr:MULTISPECIES: hypothetical protein [unclassified Demequina]MCB2413675.1 hypothetical protein [Demequina sp. TTPB684]UPU87737.1 hypothetical protein LGT36_010805 [Demequina sp. TMPB413]
MEQVADAVTPYVARRWCAVFGLTAVVFTVVALMSPATETNPGRPGALLFAGVAYVLACGAGWVSRQGGVW